MVASAIQGLAFSLSRTVAASRNNSDERPLTPPIASTSSWLNCLRPLMATVVMRKPAELASALRVSLSARDQFVDMAALDDAKRGAAEQHQHGQGDAGAVRQIALEQQDQAVRRRAIDHGPCRDAGAKAQPLAQQHDRSNSGGFQVSLGPQRSQRSSEASCTIHCTSSSNVVPAKSLAGSGTCDVSVMPGSGVDLKAEEAILSLDAVVEAEIRNSSRPGSQAPHAPPALTFGLPGKQRVNSVPGRRRVLIVPCE